MRRTRRARRPLAAMAALGALLWLGAACDALGGGGPREILFTQRLCVGQSLYRMRVGETHRIVVDNREPASTSQTNLVVRLERMPIRVDGDVPPSSTIGDPFSTVVVETNRGERKSVDVIPTGVGEFEVICNVTEGGTVAVLAATMQIVSD